MHASLRRSTLRHVRLHTTKRRHTRRIARRKLLTPLLTRLRLRPRVLLPFPLTFLRVLELFLLEFRPSGRILTPLFFNAGFEDFLLRLVAADVGLLSGGFWRRSLSDLISLSNS